MTASIGLGITVGLSRIGTALINHTDLQSLVALQIFRLPLELLMLRAALLGIMPVEFSLLGYNFDFLTGLGALLIAVLTAIGRQVPTKLLWAWNVLGIGCLLVIAVLAALTSPIVHAFGTAPVRLNTWVLYFPYALLPLLLVSCAAFGHVLMTRKLLAIHDVATGLSCSDLNSKNSSKP